MLKSIHYFLKDGIERMQLANETAIQRSRKEQKELLRDHMLVDLDQLLAPYKNKDIGLRIVAEKTEISEKTYQRIIDKVTVPHISTIERFYRYFFEIIKEEHQEARHQEIKRQLRAETVVPEVNFNHQLEKQLEDNKVLREIFLYSRTGDIDRQFVKDEFGKYGLEMLDLLLQQNVLIEREKGIYSPGRFSISKTNKAMKKIVHELIEDNLNDDLLSELGHNKAFYAIEGIDDQSKHELLLLMDEFQQRLMNFMFHQARPGTHRMFVSAAADRLKRQVKIDTNKLH